MIMASRMSLHAPFTTDHENDPYSGRLKDADARNDLMRQDEIINGPSSLFSILSFSCPCISIKIPHRLLSFLFCWMSGCDYPCVPRLVSNLRPWRGSAF